MRKSGYLESVGSITTERVYDTTTDILTGIAVNVTLRELQGYGECDLPYREMKITKNGVYDVVGYDAINVDVVNGAAVEEPDTYSLKIEMNGLRKLQRMDRYKIFVNVR